MSLIHGSIKVVKAAGPAVQLVMVPGHGADLAFQVTQAG
jgi:hypothetical protein